MGYEREAYSWYGTSLGRKNGPTDFGTSWPLAWEAHRDLDSRDACLHWIIEEAMMMGDEDWAFEAQNALDTGDNDDFDSFVRWCANAEIIL